MKNKITLLVFLFIAFASVSVFAQKDPKAKTVLDGVSQKYKSLKGLQASFEFTYGESADIVSKSQKGEIAIKGEKYHLKLPEQEIFNNGKTVWTYIESGNYKEVTINNASEMEEELTPSSVYTIYQKGYDYWLIGEKNVKGVIIQEIELASNNSNSPFKRVKLFIDKNKKDLIGWEIYDDQGGVFKYKFNSINTEVNLPDAYFTFNPQEYGKVEIIDLR
jgi:outer membrane lipoprotein-sorting protein